MPRPFITRGLPYYVPAIAFGNLLWLNLALAPAVFASQHERRFEHQASAGLAMNGAPALDSQTLEARQSPEPTMEALFEQLSGRCDDSALHEAVAFVDFETNATEPSVASPDPLGSLLDDLEGQQPRLWIDGHADVRGASDYNEGLSLLRAQAIADRLIGLGIERDRIVVRSFGETTPLVSRRPALQWKNRQAVICIEKASL